MISNEYDLLEEFLGVNSENNSPAVASSVASTSMNSPQQHVQGEIRLHPDHVFRHARELVKATHGRYLEGCIKFSSPNCILQISTTPSTESKQPLQPNLLHVTIMNETTRKATWKSTLTSKDWRVRIRIRDGVSASLLLWDGQKETEKPVNCISEGKVVLGDNGLLLTVITPLQDRNRGDPTGVRIQDVIEDRLEAEAARHPQLNVEDAKKITEQYTNKRKNPTAKIEMHRCRIRAEFLDDFGNELSPTLESSDVCNTRHNDVGALELHDMSDPRSSCTRGGYKVLLSSEFKAPTLKKNTSETPIRAVFVLEQNDGSCRPAEIVYPGFNQISLKKEDFQIHHNTLAFLVPSQNPTVVKLMSRNSDIVKIALYRPHDDTYSATKFPFTYFAHETGDDCHFCSIMGPSTLRMYSHARRNIRRRVTGGSGNATDSHGQLNPSSPSESSGIYSPGGQYDNTWSPPVAKSRRLSNEGTSSNDEVMPEVISFDQEALDTLMGATSNDNAPAIVVSEPQTTMAQPFPDLMMYSAPQQMQSSFMQSAPVQVQQQQQPLMSANSDLYQDLADLLAADSAGTSHRKLSGGFDTLDMPSQEVLDQIKQFEAEEQRAEAKATTLVPRDDMVKDCGGHVEDIRVASEEQVRRLQYKLDDAGRDVGIDSLSSKLEELSVEKDEERKTEQSQPVEKLSKAQGFKSEPNWPVAVAVALVALLVLNLVSIAGKVLN